MRDARVEQLRRGGIEVDGFDRAKELCRAQHAVPLREKTVAGIVDCETNWLRILDLRLVAILVSGRLMA